MPPFAALAFLLLVAGCTSGIDLLGDGDRDVVPPTDGDGEVGADGDADTYLGGCLGGWSDPDNGLCWQDSADGLVRSWEEAVAYCDALELGERDDWHLPTIGELRSLIRGCAGTATGGRCGVTDSCLGAGCLNDSCVGCPSFRGPGAYGCYCPPELLGCGDLFWSSSTRAEGPSTAWTAGFGSGSVDHYRKTDTRYVRCVRPGP